MTMCTKKRENENRSTLFVYNNKKTETTSYTEFQNVLQCSFNATDRPIYIFKLQHKKKKEYSLKHHFWRVVVTYMVLLIKQN